MYHMHTGVACCHSTYGVNEMKNEYLLSIDNHFFLVAACDRE